jgi:ubiquinone/menaquinone biosynthesis C-methylase UbiE
MSDYRIIAPVYDWVLYPFMRGIRRDVLEMVAQLKPGRIIDVCCGTGDQLRLFRNRGMIALGIDYSDAMLKVAARKRPDISCLKQDAAAMAFTDLSFDAAIVSMGLHETGWKQAQGILREIHRILKPSGRLIVVDYEFTAATHALVKAVIHKIEYMAGEDHFRNFQGYIRNGGLETLIDPQCYLPVEDRFHAQHSIVVRLLRKSQQHPFSQ